MRNWAPLESQRDHSDQLDQLSANGNDSRSHNLSRCDAKRVCVFVRPHRIVLAMHGYPPSGTRQTEKISNEPLMDWWSFQGPKLLITGVCVCMCVCVPGQGCVLHSASSV